MGGASSVSTLSSPPPTVSPVLTPSSSEWGNTSWRGTGSSTTAVKLQVVWQVFYFSFLTFLSFFLSRFWDPEREVYCSRKLWGTDCFLGAIWTRALITLSCLHILTFFAVRNVYSTRVGNLHSSMTSPWSDSPLLWSRARWFRWSVCQWSPWSETQTPPAWWWDGVKLRTVKVLMPWLEPSLQNNRNLRCICTVSYLYL